MMVIEFNFDLRGLAAIRRQLPELTAETDKSSAISGEPASVSEVGGTENDLFKSGRGGAPTQQPLAQVQGDNNSFSSPSTRRLKMASENGRRLARVTPNPNPRLIGQKPAIANSLTEKQTRKQFIIK